MIFMFCSCVNTKTVSNADNPKQNKSTTMTNDKTKTPKPEIITKKWLLAGFQAEVDVKDEHWPGMDYVQNALNDVLGEIANQTNPGWFVGMWQADPNADYDKPENRSKHLYFYGVEVSDMNGIPGNCIVKDLPEHRFAVFKNGQYSSGKYAWLNAAGYSPDRKFQKEHALDMDLFDDIYGRGSEWLVLIPIE